MGRIDNFDHFPQNRFMNKTKRGAPSEDSSAEERDSKDLSAPIRNIESELFDVEVDFAGNLKLWSDIRAPNSFNNKPLKSDAQKAIGDKPKNKTDTFLVTSLPMDFEKKSKAIVNTDLRRKPDRGGSHNFNLLSQQDERGGDFEVESERREEVLGVQTKGIFNIPEDHNSSDEEESTPDSRHDRRDAGEVDFDF